MSTVSDRRGLVPRSSFMLLLLLPLLLPFGLFPGKKKRQQKEEEEEEEEDKVSFIWLAPHAPCTTTLAIRPHPHDVQLTSSGSSGTSVVPKPIFQNALPHVLIADARHPQFFQHTKKKIRALFVLHGHGQILQTPINAVKGKHLVGRDPSGTVRQAGPTEHALHFFSAGGGGTTHVVVKVVVKVVFLVGVLKVVGWRWYLVRLVKFTRRCFGPFPPFLPFLPLVVLGGLVLGVCRLHVLFHVVVLAVEMIPLVGHRTHLVAAVVAPRLFCLFCLFRLFPLHRPPSVCLPPV